MSEPAKDEFQEIDVLEATCGVIEDRLDRRQKERRPPEEHGELIQI